MNKIVSSFAFLGILFGLSLSVSSQTSTTNSAKKKWPSTGSIFKTFEDFQNINPVPGYEVKQGSYVWSLVTGTTFKLVNTSAKTEDRVGSDKLPGEFIFYSENNYSFPSLLCIKDKKPYIILAYGKLCYYALYLDQKLRYYSEGQNGEMKKFKEGAFEDYLEKYNLLEDYKKDKPKREMKDDVNGYYNKTIKWQIDYFNKLNNVM